MSCSAAQLSQLLAGPYTRLLAEHEQAIADLYTLFADTFPKAESFWLALAREETGHVKVLLKLEEKQENGQWAFKRPAFTTATIVESLERLADKMETTRKQGISMWEALGLAVAIETDLAEGHYFDVLDHDTAGMMKTIRFLAGECERHVKHVELEARRLKWRVLGRRTAWPGSSKKSPSPSGLRASVKTAQAGMLGRLISLEEATGALYAIFSRRLPDRSDFWARMATEEMQHAAVLRGLYSVLEHGWLFHNVERFNKAAMHADMEFVLACAFKVEHRVLSARTAANMALRIERSPCANGFYTTVDSDAPEFRFIAENMNRHMADHLKRIEEEAHHLGDAAKDPWGTEPRPTPTKLHADK